MYVWKTKNCNYLKYVKLKQFLQIFGHIMAYISSMKIKLEEEEKEKVTIGFDCKDCKYIGQSQFRLNRHVQSLHSNERFKCLLCVKILSREDKLAEHRLRVQAWSLTRGE